MIYQLFSGSQLLRSVDIKSTLQVVVCKFVLESLDIGLDELGDEFTDPRVKLLECVSEP